MELKMLKGIHSTSEVLDAGYPRESLKIWHETGRNVIIQLTKEQYDYMQENMNEETKKDLHFCNVNGVYATAIDFISLLVIKIIFQDVTDDPAGALVLSSTMTPKQVKEILDAKTSGVH